MWMVNKLLCYMDFPPGETAATSMAQRQNMAVQD